MDNALADGPQGQLGGLERLTPSVVIGTHSGTDAGLTAEGLAREPLAQLGRSGCNELAQLGQRG